MALTTTHGLRTLRNEAARAVPIEEHAAFSKSRVDHDVEHYAALLQL